MTKKEFVKELKKRLTGLPQNEIEKSVDYYSELIDDYIEDGFDEEDAVLKLDSMDSIVKKIKTDIPIYARAKEIYIKSNKKISIVLLCIGFPLWFPLLIAFFSIILALYIVMWSIIIAIASCGMAFIISSIVFFLYSPTMFMRGFCEGAFVFGSAIILIGLSLLTYELLIIITKYTIALTKALSKKVKLLFVKKEEI